VITDLVSDLRGAVGRGEIVPYYQPQVDIHTLEIVSVEMLARWMHPEFGMVLPSIFIPLAEAHSSISEIGTFLMREAVRQTAEWCADGFEVEVAINVSAAQLSDLAFLEAFQDSIGEAELAPEKLTLEITESLPLIRVEEVSARLAELRELGVGVSIDDFGAGYSVVTELAGIPANEIKIDKALIQDAASSEKLLRSVVDDAHSTGRRVLAEGVETAEHLALARALTCDRAQGYLFGRPVPEAHLTLPPPVGQR
jgi:EAL domain-containing protein (putative c-di-GMP-specific phosphodiesterase class I)